MTKFTNLWPWFPCTAVEPNQWRLGWSKRQEPPGNHFDDYCDDNDYDDEHLDNLLLAAELVDKHVLPVVHLRQGHVELPVHLSDGGDDDENDDDGDYYLYEIGADVCVVCVIYMSQK